MPRVFSGIQPSGEMHLGNYLGAVRRWVDDQHRHDAIHCVVDLHAITVAYDPADLADRTRRTAMLLLAAGIDPERTTLFVQSHVHAHTELTWLLNCVATYGELRRMTQFKEKGEGQGSVSVGLLDYPVLMAADILIYDSDVVPVGKDQKQHLEVTRDIAVKINETFGDVFKLPEPRIQSSTETVPGVDGQKMSKSYGNTIDIFGEEKETRKRIMSIVTDSTPVEASKDPDSSTIVQLYSLFASDEELKAMKDAFRQGGTGYGDFKKQLAGKLWEYFEPMRQRRTQILNDSGYIDEVLKRGANRANEIADQVMDRVRGAVGL